MRLACLREVGDSDPSGLIDDDGFETCSDNVAGAEAYLLAKKRGFNGFLTTEEKLGNEWMLVRSHPRA